MINRKTAFKEAVADTFLAFLINFPLNMLLLYLANRHIVPVFDNESQQIFWTSVFLTAIFTTVAIIRKTYTRMYFETRNLKKKAKKG